MTTCKSCDKEVDKVCEKCENCDGCGCKCEKKEATADAGESAGESESSEGEASEGESKEKTD